MALLTPHVITPDSALGGIQIQKSLRIDQGTADTDSGSNYSRTFASGNRKTFTISLWLKKCNTPGNIGDDQYTIFGCGGGGTGSYSGRLNFNTSDQLTFRVNAPAPTAHADLTTTRKFRDPSSWYHIVFVADTTQGTASNRLKLYVNGVQETDFASTTYPSQNYDLYLNLNVAHRIGSNSIWSDLSRTYGNFNGYFAEFHFLDGTAYDPSYFGYTDSQTGQWRPKIYTSGNYGTNGFYLDFKDNTSATTLGLDKSGQSNNFTPEDVSVSAGIGDDSMIDTPTNNWCIWNQVSDVSDITLSEGNLKSVSGVDSWPAVFGTHGASSGKWYYEAIGADNTRWGLGWSIEDFKSGTSNTFSVGHFAYSQDPLTLYQDGSNVAINGTPAFTTGNVLQIATDIDAGKTWFGINNTWVNASNGSAGDPAAGTNPTITFSEKGQKHYPKMINNLGNVSVNFGQQGFTYTPPDGFQALNSKNLATVNGTGVVRPQRHFDTLTYTGNNNSGRVITGLEFKPDFVWFKKRSSGSQNHTLYDSLRGAGKRLMLPSTDGEGTVSDELTSFNDGGFTIDTDNFQNENGKDYVAWCWRAGGAAVTNTVGNISAQVSANDEAGFSIITYTGDGNTSGNVGTGLRSTQPLDWAIVKRRDSTSDWQVGHRASGQSSNFAYHTNLNDTSALSGSSPYHMGTQNYTNGDRLYLAEGGLTSSATYVAYVWQERPGFSAFGSYTGNGSDDGPYVHLGFKAAWIMFKLVDGGNDDWPVYDIKRDPINACDHRLFANATTEEGAVGQEHFDILSNGIKFRKQKNPFNNSGKIYIYMAFAERPSGTIFGLDANGR
mgnify:CR=1 FL=1